MTLIASEAIQHTGKSKRKNQGALLDAIKETKTAPRPQMVSMQLEQSSTRGRKPLGADKLRLRIRAELSKQFIKIEKEAYKFFPESNGEVKEHVLEAIRRVVE